MLLSCTFFFFSQCWLQIQRKPWEQLGQKWLQEDLTPSLTLCGEEREQKLKQLPSVSFTGSELCHFKWKLRKKCEWWSATCLCWDVTHLHVFDLTKPLMLRTPVHKFCQKTHRLASDFWVWLNGHTSPTCLLWLLKQEKTPKMQKTKVDLHNGNKLLIEHI